MREGGGKGKAGGDLGVRDVDVFSGGGRWSVEACRVEGRGQVEQGRNEESGKGREAVKAG